MWFFTRWFIHSLRDWFQGLVSGISFRDYLMEIYPSTSRIPSHTISSSLLSTLLNIMKNLVHSLTFKEIVIKIHQEKLTKKQILWKETNLWNEKIMNYGNTIFFVILSFLLLSFKYRIFFSFKSSNELFLHNIWNNYTANYYW